jgi:hypothetical protein
MMISKRRLALGVWGMVTMMVATLHMVHAFPTGSLAKNQSWKTSSQLSNTLALLLQRRNLCHIDWIKPLALSSSSSTTSRRYVGFNAEDGNDIAKDGPDGDDDNNNIRPIPLPPSSSSSSSLLMMEQAKLRLDSIQVEKARHQLEQANTQAFLKRRPLKLPYVDARRWIQANLGCDTKEEHDDFVANGNLRTPYIPKNPEAYYTSTREWISWDHYLKGCFDGQHPSAVQPPTGIFD